MFSVTQKSFFNTGFGVLTNDGRVIFDPNSQRFIISTTDLATSTIYLAVSTTSDPTQNWFKTSFLANTGTDAGRGDDYPTLGVDARGVYIAALMYPSAGPSGGEFTMTLFAIDKAPLVATPQSIGAVTAFRHLPYEGAIRLA